MKDMDFLQSKDAKAAIEAGVKSAGLANFKNVPDDLAGGLQKDLCAAAKLEKGRGL